MKCFYDKKFKMQFFRSVTFLILEPSEYFEARKISAHPAHAAHLAHAAHTAHPAHPALANF